jgi:HPP family
MNSRKSDFVFAPLAEGGLILLLAAIGWATRWPFVFASLGPTAYEMIEQPQMKSARPYNVIVGHLTGLALGWLALWATHAWGSPKVSAVDAVPMLRMWAALISVVLTTLVTLLLSASQPASLATTLLVSLGLMQTGRDAAAIVISVLILAAVGEPIRRKRLKAAQHHELATSKP